MSKIAYVHNGTAKAKNGATAKNGKRRKSAKGRRKNSTALSLSRVQSYVKKNGLKLSKRNGTTSAPRSRNGILGNTKSDAKQVGFLALGAAITKGVGRILAGFISPYLSRTGLGKYTTIISDGVVALVAVPFIGQKTLGKEAATFGRLGGLLVMGLDAVNVFAPDTLGAYNPFVDMSPIVLANGQAAFSPDAVAAIAQEVADSPDPQAAASKVAGTAYAMSAGLGFVPEDSFGSGSDAGYTGLRPMSM